MSDAEKPKYQRSARNYLLDKQFQLKYTGFLVIIALVMSVVLGLLLWKTSSAVVDQSRETVVQGEAAVRQGRETVEQGRETVRQSQLSVERGKEVIAESRKVSEAVAMQIQNYYADNPILQKTYQKDSADEEAKRAAEQKKFEDDAADLEKRADALQARADAIETQANALKTQSAAIERGQRNMFIGLVVALAVLVLGIGIAGIVFTHRIAGPIFKMKRLMREVGEGKLVLHERLRKGDELHHFFETFEKMVEKMRENQRQEIARIDEIRETLTTDRDAGISALKSLRDDMADHIEA